MYLVEYNNRRYIVRARSKLQASVRVEKIIPGSFVSSDCVKRLPKDDTVYEVKNENVLS